MTRVFLLHGLGADRRAFQRFERLLPDEWQIESLDLLGHGSAPHPPHGYALDDHARYIAGELRTRGVSSADRAILVGHSYGAATSVAVAALAPDLVARIVLLDPVVRLETQGHGRTSLTQRIIQARRDGTLEATIEQAYPQYSDALRAWTVETWTNMALGVVDELDPEWTRFADQVTCPVAIIHGDLDEGGAGDLAADWFDEPHVTRIAGAGHYLHATHARETAAAVAEAVTS